MTEPGLVVVDKPAGITSHDVVARVRRLAGTRKVGHAGTLDPMATGVLVIGVERATRLLGHLMLTDKAYDATVRLGVATTTDDAEGEVVSTASAAGLDEDDGPRGARRASSATSSRSRPRSPRSRSTASAPTSGSATASRSSSTPRPVTVHELDVHDVRRGGDVVDVDVSLRCSSGTYVRAIARDARRRARRRRPPDRAAAYRRRPLRPRRRPHPRPARRPVRACCRSRTPRARPSRRVDLDDAAAARRPGRPARSTSARPD